MGKFPYDPNAKEFHFRPGSPIFGEAGWDGVNTEDLALNPNELQRGENIRFQGKIIRTRTGQVPILELPSLASVGPISPGQVMWMKEAPMDNPHIRLWYSALGCFGAAIGTGGTIFNFDQSQNPQNQIYARFFSGSDKTVCLGGYGDKLFAGDKTAVRGVVLLAAPTGQDMNNFVTSPPSTPFGIYTGYTITFVQEFDSKLFIGLSNDAAPGASKIVTYDGIVFQDDITGIRPPLAAGTWQGKLVVGFDSTAANIRVRNTGASPGTWNTFALAGSSCAPFGNAICEVGTKTYIASGFQKIFQFDGAALTLANTIGTADLAGGYGVNALCKHNNMLYYGWNVVNPWQSKIGRHDPDSTFSAATEWVDTYKDVSADANTLTFRRLTSMASHRGSIFVGGSRYWLAATADNDVKGAMQPIVVGSAAAGFEIQQLLNF